MEKIYYSSQIILNPYVVGGIFLLNGDCCCMIRSNGESPKKKILITAGGTATAWHICTIIKRYFDEDFEIHLCDINPPELIPAEIYSQVYHRVPPINDPKYMEHMYSLLKRESIDIIIPLIDFDLFLFPSDSPRLQKLGVVSTAPPLHTVRILSDKRSLYHFLHSQGLPTPMVYQVDEVDPHETYAVKSAIGFGSRNFCVMKGSDILASEMDSDVIIQEFCAPVNDTHEITAEIFCFGGSLKIFCRERIEVKAGVCTKMKPFFDQSIELSLNKLVKSISCPTAFCVQFLYNKGRWEIIDCNLRLGAGTALSSAIGFQLTRALLLTLLNKPVPNDIFIVNPSVKSVLRVYDEVVIT